MCLFRLFYNCIDVKIVNFFDTTRSNVSTVSQIYHLNHLFGFFVTFAVIQYYLFDHVSCECYSFISIHEQKIPFPSLVFSLNS